MTGCLQLQTVIVGRSLDLTVATTGVETPVVGRLPCQMVRGDEDAFREFHTLYFDRLLRYLLVLLRGDEDAARDALQEVFVRVVRYIKPMDDEAKLWSWLTVVAHSAVIDQQRKRKRYLAFLDAFWQKRVDKEETPDDTADQELLLILEEGLQYLNENERDLLRNKYLEGMSVSKLALMVGESEKAIESRLTRVRKKLREIVLKRMNHEK